jgi:arylsulfatase
MGFLYAVVLLAGGAGAIRAVYAAEPGAALSGLRPNIILVMTDDQGYGDLACLGNPKIKTPNLDAMYARSLRFTCFQVSPTCSPTRAALMTGRHEFRSGVTHTYKSRERLDLKAVTLAEVLRDAGYQTGIFGKWHLGDGEAYQPPRRGFDESFIHGAGGIAQFYPSSADAEDNQRNPYFDPILRHNGTFVQTRGFCTDIFFTQALRWIKSVKGGPFFAYLPTNAPHVPFIAPEKYMQPYLQDGLDKKVAGFYGMITNIDDNMARLFRKLDEWGLTGKTLVIFMTDNGTWGGETVYNAGMKGMKATADEGGTRVPAFFQWPGKLPEGVDVDRLAAHIDLFPTFVDLCGAKAPKGVVLDGRSLVPLLEDPKADWPDRYLFTHVGRWPAGKADASKYKKCAVRSQRYRFVNNRELFDMEKDPGQKRNVAEQKPKVVAAMRKAYNAWWREVRPAMINERAKPEARPYQQAYQKQKAGPGIPEWVTDDP